MGQSGKAPNQRRARAPRTFATLRALAASGLIAVGALGTLTPNASAGDTSKPGQADPTDLATGGPVSSIPYAFPDDGGSGGGGGSADPSIAIRPAFEAMDPPSEKTAVQDAWTRDSRLWANPDGTYTVESGQRLNFVDTNGSWAPIDLSLVADAAGDWRPAATASDVRLKADASDGTVATLTGDLGTVSPLGRCRRRGQGR